MFGHASHWLNVAFPIAKEHFPSALLQPAEVDVTTVIIHRGVHVSWYYAWMVLLRYTDYTVHYEPR